MNKFIGVVICIAFSLAGSRWIAEAHTDDLDIKLIGTLMLLGSGVLFGIIVAHRKGENADTISHAMGNEPDGKQNDACTD